MKTKIIISVLLILGFCSCEYEFSLDSHAHSESSVSATSSECSYNGFTAGIQISAVRQNGRNSVKTKIYAQSESVDSIHLTNENTHLDTISPLPYSETFNYNDILFNEKYEYVISWEYGDVTKSILIDYVILWQDSRMEVECHSVVQ